MFTANRFVARMMGRIGWSAFSDAMSRQGEKLVWVSQCTVTAAALRVAGSIAVTTKTP